ncbi:hypothetical protein NQ314_003419 [Rhamnusium bicolor]|uniref:Uncharacterized protein n=1 Tax=Rhamnusium bicolor TaxID=1586634 RepID=A0AAV8ZPB1_9CUCU|nr:hypothetical protein NQ314_003419 [Rhamnusium bicolor]
MQQIDKEKNPEIYNSLSEEGKRAAHEYVRFSIREKLARGVPVLLHMEMKQCIDVILKHRENAGILPDNPYLFALPQSQKQLNTNF